METILGKIHTGALAFLGPLTLVDTYAVIGKEAKELVRAEFISVFLWQDGVLKRVYGSSSKLSAISPRKNGYTFKAFTNKEAFVIDATKEKNVNPQILALGVRSMIFIPLVLGKESLGVLTADSRKQHFFTEKELKTLPVFGSMAMVAIKKAELFDQIQESVAIRDHFISLAAHELRTPLTSINGYIQLLHSRMGAKKTAEGRWVESLLFESRRLTKLVEELLEVNRLKAGKLRFSLGEAHMKDILKVAIKKSEEKYPSHRFTFRNGLAKSDIITGDFDKLTQVVVNLLDNAAKFSSPKSPITTILKSDGQTLRVQITDKGEGIAQKDIPQITRGFYKGSTLKGGIALGLLMAKHIIGYHKGSLSITSKKHKGTTVEVTLPRRKS